MEELDPKHFAKGVKGGKAVKKRSSQQSAAQVEVERGIASVEARIQSLCDYLKEVRFLE